MHTLRVSVAAALALGLVVLSRPTRAEGKPPLLGYEVETVPGIRWVAASPTGRHLAWQEGDHVRLLDGWTGERVDLPGPPLPPLDPTDEPDVTLHDRYVAWRVPHDAIESPKALLLYDIRSGELTEVHPLAGSSGFFLGYDLVFVGQIPDDGVLVNHVFVYDAKKDRLEDVTPLVPRFVGWLTGDGSTIAWTAGHVGGQDYTQVWAMDLGRGEKVLIQDGDGFHFRVKVAGSTVTWISWDGSNPETQETRAAFLRPRGCGGGLEAEMALVAPLVAWRPLRRRWRA
jgi:hypothetical protein